MNMKGTFFFCFDIPHVSLTEKRFTSTAIEMDIVNSLINRV